MALNNPSPQQTVIFDWFAVGRGNAIVRARAGCGKTTTIIEAINFAQEPKILLAAFNKEIAEELKRRLRNPRARAQTLHSLGNYYIWKKWGSVTIDSKRGLRLAASASGFDPLNLSDAQRDWSKLVNDLASLGKNISPFATPAELSDIALDFGVIPEGDDADHRISINRLANHAHQAMQLATQKDGCIDFDDMIFLPVRNRWAFPMYGLVVIDEAQDMNPTQLQLAQKACKRGGRICVVGDDRQAIYAFRGADSNALDNLKKTLKATEFGLTVTYRCPKAVVQEARILVEDFEAHETAPEGIVDSATLADARNNAVPGNFVLSRTNAPLVGVCLGILRNGNRAFIRGRDIGASLTKIVKDRGVATIPALAEAMHVFKTRMFEKLTSEDAKDEAFQRVEDQVETISVLSEGLATTKELIARIESLFTDATPSDSVICSTIHKAKGLEAEHVYLMRDTFRRAFKNDEEVDNEELNLAYVGITRAKQRLTYVSGK